MPTRHVGWSLVVLSLLAAAVSVSFAAPIHRAASNDDVQTITALLHTDPQLVNAQDEAGRTPLLCAATRGRKAAVMLLLSRGAQVDVSDMSGDTPLAMAVGHPLRGMLSDYRRSLGGQVDRDQSDPQDYRDIVAMLLEEHADPNTRHVFSGSTPLHGAASGGDPEMVRLLCEHGADVNAKDDMGSTPLHAAAATGMPLAAQVLLSHGADANALNQRGASPLYAAAWSGDVATAQLLLDNGADVNASDASGMTPMYDAAMRASDGVVKLLLARGYRVTSVVDALLIGDAQRVQEFLHADPQLVNSRLAPGGSDAPTLLHLAARAGLAEMVELLISEGADVNAEAQDGATPLHETTYWLYAGGPEVAAVLLAHGAEVDAQDDYGSTSLHFALNSPHQTELMAALLAAGADPDIADDEGRTPLHLAVHVDQQEMHYVRAAAGLAGRPVSDVLSALARSGSKLAMDALLSGGANIDAGDNRGVTALHIAAYSGYADAVDILLARGASARAKTNDGRTPLHQVAMGDGSHPVRRHMAQALLANGADVTAKNAAGKTPADVAEAKEDAEMLALFRRAAAEHTSE